MRRQHLRIENKTHWSTKDLRKLFLRCMKERGVYGKWNRYWLKVSYSKGWRHIMGYGKCDGPWVHILLPGPRKNGGENTTKELQEFGSGSILRVVQILLHEIDHNLGLHHEDMCRSSQIEAPWAVTGNYSIAWNDPKVKVKKAKEEKPTTTLQERRAANAEKKLKEWEAKQKRAALRVKKWRAKVRYYDKALAKKAALPKEKKT